eukprot:14660237-Alexandrium_andersonii.AAC.1
MYSWGFRRITWPRAKTAALYFAELVKSLAEVAAPLRFEWAWFRGLSLALPRCAAQSVTPRWMLKRCRPSC